MTKEEKLELLEDIFSPSSPISRRDLFFGRIDQISEIVHTIEERGQHGVLYGERGVGKTSLANIIDNDLSNITCSKVTCNRTENFRDIWTKALSKIRFSKSKSGIGFNANVEVQEMQLNLFLPDKKTEIDSTDIQNIFEKLKDNLLFIFDEFDSIEDESTKIRFADTIKALSDNSGHVTILIVGIAKDITELIGIHPSLERCIRQIKMPKMSNSELKEIITNGLKKLELKIEPSVTSLIINFSSGFPHYTHLLSKYACFSAILKNSNLICNSDFDFAVEKAISNINQVLRKTYQQATISSKKEKTQFEDVLQSVALADTDEFDCSSITEILHQFNLLRNSNVRREAITYNLGMLCKNERGEILERIESGRNIKYRFRNPIMKAYTKLILHNREKMNLKLLM